MSFKFNLQNIYIQVTVKTEIMTQKVADSSYDATKNAGKIKKLTHCIVFFSGLGIILL